VRSGLVLSVGDRARADFVSEIGIVERRVEIRGEAPLAQADSSGLGEVIENRRIADMPLNNRNALALTHSRRECGIWTEERTSVSPISKLPARQYRRERFARYI